MFQKKKRQINILENQLVLSYSVQPKGIITQTLILVDLLWVCCCCCFQFKSLCCWLETLKQLVDWWGWGQGGKKRDDFVPGGAGWNWSRIWVKLVLAHSSSSHGFAVSFDSACHRRYGWQLQCDRHLEDAVVCIGSRSPESSQDGKKPGFYSLASSFPMDLRILCTGYSLNIMDTSGELIGAKIK